MTSLHTDRLRLEPFQDAHLEGLHAINGDPVIMRYITGQPQTVPETQDAIRRVKARWAEFGYSWWSFIDRAGGDIVGAGCIQNIGGNRDNPVEIGWRLRQDFWHRGLASEAARAMADFAFTTLAIPELIAVAQPENQASRRVMERLGMHFRGMEHWYDREVATYAISRSQWEDRTRRPS